MRGYPPAGGHEPLGRVYHQVRLGFVVIGKLIVCFFLNLSSVFCDNYCITLELKCSLLLLELLER